MDHSALLARMNRGWIESVDTLGYMRLSYVSDIVPKGKVAPLDYCSDLIRNVIISARRQNVLINLEQDLLNDALKNEEFVIY